MARLCSTIMGGKSFSNEYSQRQKGVNNCDKSGVDNKHIYISPLKQYFVIHHFSPQCYENIPSTDRSIDRFLDTEYVIGLASANTNQRYICFLSFFLPFFFVSFSFLFFFFFFFCFSVLLGFYKANNKTNNNKKNKQDTTEGKNK